MKKIIIRFIISSILLISTTSVQGKENIICIQVIQPAYNTVTGECKEFATPCDVPEKGWKKISSCNKIPKIENNKIIKKQGKLDSKLKVKADILISRLIKRIEVKYGTNNQAKITKLTILISKLYKIKEKITSEKTKLLIDYLINSIKERKKLYSVKNEIDEIFNN